MGQYISYEKDELIVVFTGLTAWAGLKKEIKIPYKSIKSVETGNFKLNWKALRVGGTSIPGRYKAGRYYYEGEKMFLHYKNPSQVVVIELQDHDYDRIVIEAGTPKEVRNAIQKRMQA